MRRVVVDSAFFNNPELWSALEENYLPSLFAEGGAIRALSAGCGSGKEPFSLAILLDQLAPGASHYILAVDKNSSALKRARAGGAFTANDIRWLSEELREIYLRPTPAGFFVKPFLLAKIRFAPADLVHDSIADKFDIILYRDLETCFTEASNHQLYRTFSDLLRPGGLLFVGAMDRVPPSLAAGYKMVEPSIYRKLDRSDAHPFLHAPSDTRQKMGASTKANRMDHYGQA